MHKSLVTTLAAISFAAISSTAHAADLEVTVYETISGVNQEVASWTQDQDPTPVAYVSGFYTTVPVYYAVGLGGDTAVTYYSNTNDQLGGFTNYSEDYNILTDTSYASNESQPVFLPGTYHGVDVKPDLTYVLASYTIAVIPAPLFTPKFSLFHVETAAVPEPSSWAMMFAGLGMIGFVVRRRRTVSNADA